MLQYCLISIIVILTILVLVNIYKSKKVELTEEFTTTQSLVLSKIQDMYKEEVIDDSKKKQITTYLDTLLKSIEGDYEKTVDGSKSKGVFNELYKINNTISKSLFSDQHFKDKEEQLEKAMEFYYFDRLSTVYYSLQNKNTDDIINYDLIHKEDNENIIYANYGLLTYDLESNTLKVIYSYNEGDKSVYFKINKLGIDEFTISPMLNKEKVLHMDTNIDSYVTIGEKDDTLSWKFKKINSTDNSC